MLDEGNTMSEQIEQSTYSKQLAIYGIIEEYLIQIPMRMQTVGYFWFRVWYTWQVQRMHRMVKRYVEIFLKPLLGLNKGIR